MEVELAIKGDLRKLRLCPGDILAVRLTEPNTQPEIMYAIAENLRRMVKKTGHDIPVLVADKGMDILVISTGE